MSVNQKRVLISQPSKLSIKCQCALLGLHRSTHYYKPHESMKETELLNLIADIHLERPQYAYRKVTAVLKRKGHTVNSKKVKAYERDGAPIHPSQAPNVHSQQRLSRLSISSQSYSSGRRLQKA